MSELPTGSKIAGVAAHVAVVAFFLPWITVSCYGTPVASASGYNMAVGTWRTAFGASNVEPVREVFLILAAAILIALMFYAAYTRGYVSIPWSLSQIVISAVTLVILALIAVKAIEENTSPRNAMLQMSARPELGLMLTIVSFLVIILSSYMAIVDIRRGYNTPIGTGFANGLGPPGSTKKCPYCAETILADAIICRYCRRELVLSSAQVQQAQLVLGGIPSPPNVKARQGSTAELSVLRCPHCGEQINLGEDVCPNCGKALCPNCGAALDDDATQCPSCGATLELFCPRCDAVQKPGSRTCSACGVKFIFPCPRCNQEIDLGLETCPHCGVGLCAKCGAQKTPSGTLCTNCGASFGFV